MPVAGFQTIADELNPFYQKSGDYGGYCLAWCTWYLEHRIKNKNISPKNLVDKLLKKLSYNKDSFMEYIRNYANKLNTFRVNNYKKIGIDDKTTSNTRIDNKTNRLLNNYIIKYFKSY
jgi:UDP-glucose 6-dehydrogenase